MPAIRPRSRLGIVLAALSALALAVAGPADAHGGGKGANVYKKRNLVSDIDGVARITDSHLVNPWGLAFGPATPAWVSDNGMDVSTLYSGGVRKSIPVTLPLVVGIPGGAPTGVVFNGTPGFKVGGAPAHFIFDSEAGTITAWNSGTDAVTEATTPGGRLQGPGHRDQGQHDDALRRELRTRARSTSSTTRSRPPRCPAASPTPTCRPASRRSTSRRSPGSWSSPSPSRTPIPRTSSHGPGLGYVDVFDTQGHLVRRLVSQGALNAPWGLAVAPRHFGPFSGDLLVGNFGDGAINAYDPRTGAFRGTLQNKDGNQIKINGLWALRFGNGVIGTPQSLLFTAGIGDEDHGLFGEIVVRGSGE